MLFSIIDALTKDDWDGICDVIETTGKAIAGVTAAYGTVIAAEALLEKAKGQPKVQIEDNINELLRAKIEEACGGN
jgi:hypothetical protein